MFASLIVPDPTPARVLTVPAAAVQELDGSAVVFVPAGEDRSRRQVVEVGRRGDGWVEIRSGLQPSQRIVGQGSFLLKSTLVLRVQPAGD